MRVETSRKSSVRRRLTPDDGPRPDMFDASRAFSPDVVLQDGALWKRIDKTDLLLGTPQVVSMLSSSSQEHIKMVPPYHAIARDSFRVGCVALHMWACTAARHLLCKS